MLTPQGIDRPWRHADPRPVRSIQLRTPLGTPVLGGRRPSRTSRGRINAKVNRLLPEICLSAGRSPKAGSLALIGLSVHETRDLTTITSLCSHDLRLAVPLASVPVSGRCKEPELTRQVLARHRSHPGPPDSVGDFIDGSRSRARALMTPGGQLTKRTCLTVHRGSPQLCDGLTRTALPGSQTLQPSFAMTAFLRPGI